MEREICTLNPIIPKIIKNHGGISKSISVKEFIIALQEMLEKFDITDQLKTEILDFFILLRRIRISNDPRNGDTLVTILAPDNNPETFYNSIMLRLNIVPGGIPSGTTLQGPKIGEAEEIFKSEELDDTEELAYGKNLGLRSHRSSNFKRDFISAILINTSKDILGRTTSTIVSNNAELNMSIANYKESLFQSIVEYLQSKDLLPKESLPMYSNRKNFNASIYNKVMVTMKNFIEKGGSELQETLKRIWTKSLDNISKTQKESNSYKKDMMLLTAVDAFVTLSNFDDILKEEGGDIVQINENYEGINCDLKDINNKNILKYHLGKDESHLVKSWTTSEYRDAVKEGSRLSKLILSTVSLTTRDGNNYQTTLQLKDVINAFSNLLQSLDYIGEISIASVDRADKSDSIINIINELHTNPLINMPKLLLKLISNSSFSLLCMSLFLTSYDYDVLYSFYNTLVDHTNNKSIFSIEKRQLESGSSFLTETLLTDVITGIEERSAAANYNATTYTLEYGYETKAIRKASNVRKISKDYLSSRNLAMKLMPENERRYIIEDVWKINLSLGPNKYKSTVVSIVLNGRIFSFAHESTQASRGLNNFLSESAGNLISASSTIEGEPARQLLKSLNKINSLSKNSISNLTTLLNAIKDIINGKQAEDLEVAKVDNEIYKYSASELKDLAELFKFIDDMLLLDLTSELGIQILTSALKRSFKIETLLKDALRVALGLVLYQGYNEYVDKTNIDDIVSFKDWLGILAPSFRELTKRRSTYQTNKDGSEYLVAIPASNKNDNWVNAWFMLKSDITGESSKATTNNIAGDKIANSRPGSLAYRFKLQIRQIKSDTRSHVAALNLVFCLGSNTFLVKEMLYDLDLVSSQGIKKSVKSANFGETIYNGFMNHFLGSLLDGHILILPTVYSDKTSFVLYKIDSSKNDLIITTYDVDLNGNKIQGSEKEIKKRILFLTKLDLIDIYRTTIGLYFRDAIHSILEHWNVVLSEPRNTQLLIDRGINLENINTITGLNLELHKLKKSDIELLLRNCNESAKLIKEFDYCIINGKVSLNQEVTYYNSFLFNEKNLEERFKLEEKIFLQSILDSNLNIYTYFLHDQKINESNSTISKILDLKDSLFTALFGISKESFIKSWIKNGKLILGKKKNVSVINGEEVITYSNYLSGDQIHESDEIILNPLLEKYFYTDTVFSNSLKYSLTGSELNHPNKAKFNLRKELEHIHNDLGIGLTPSLLNSINDLTDLYAVISTLPKDGLLYLKLNNLYLRLTRKIISSCEGTQYKRNVIIPATMQHLTLGSLVGMPAKMKVAIIDDPQGEVFNINGDLTKIDANDGSARILAITSIWENGSLADLAVGYSSKKPITHYYDPETGTCLLFKYATFAITNASMRLSYESTSSDYTLMKKMTNISWYKTTGKRYDLLNSAYYRKGHYLDFLKDVCSHVSGNELYYVQNNVTYKIHNMLEHNGIYYTLESRVKNSELIELIKVAQVFDNKSNALKIRLIVGETDEEFYARVENIIKLLNLHTIDSVFELWLTLGGYESLSKNDDGRLEYSEASNYALAAFIDNVQEEVENEDKKFLTQKAYRLPLKELMIHYALNPTAVKNYLANINSTENWNTEEEYDDLGNMKKLLYFEIPTTCHGIQMDPQHEADEAEMAEPTQVIASLDAGGATHWLAREAFKDLGKIAVEKLKTETKALEDFILKFGSKNIKDRDQVRSELYDVFARAFINHFKSTSNFDLSNSIIDSVKNIFGIGHLHGEDDFKLPISDPNIYSLIVSTFITKVNTAIKRESPGLGTVMVPGYNRALLWHLPSQTGEILPMLAEDIYKIATARLFIWDDEKTKKDASFYNHKFHIEESEDGYKITSPDITEENPLTKLEELRLKCAIADNLKIGKKITWVDGTTEVLTQYNNAEVKRKIINLYLLELQYKQNEDGSYVQLVDIDKVDPTDIINIYINNDVSENNKLTFNLTNLDSYYMFKHHHWGYFYDINLPKSRKSESILTRYYKFANTDSSISQETFYKDKHNLVAAYEWHEKLIETLSENERTNPYLRLYKANNIIVLNDILHPRNLAPQKTHWTYDGGKFFNVYDIKEIYEEYLNSHIKRTKLRQNVLDNALRRISETGEFTLLDGTVKIIDEGSLENEAAELMMSNIYKTTFGQGNRSLYECLNSFRKLNIDAIKCNLGQFSLVTSSGKNIFIKIGNVNLDDNINPIHWKASQLSWFDDNNFKGEVKFIDYVLSNGTKLNIGRSVRSDKYTTDGATIFDENNKPITKKDQDLLHLRIDNGFVWLDIFFIKKYDAHVQSDNKTYSYNQIYSFDRKAMIDFFTKYNKEKIGTEEELKTRIENGIDSYIGSQIYKIYNQNDCARIQLVNNIKTSEATVLSRIITNIGTYKENFEDFEIQNDLDIFLLLRNIARKTLDLISKYNTEEVDLSLTKLLYKPGKNNTYISQLNDFLKEITHLRKTSFEMSRFFTAARIPALTLQSYMQMKLVGYIPIKSNECMVSHWQTWLQGSDYDIDKAYIMGYSFGKSGLFIHWSPLFDFSSIKTLRASSMLPTPSKNIIKLSDDTNTKGAKKIINVIENSKNNFSNLVNRINIIDALIQSSTDPKKIDALKVLKLELLSRLISEIDNIEDDNITLGENYEKIVELINKHEMYLIQENKLEEAIQNSISSRIQHIVNSVANISLATSPISMDDLHDAAEHTPKSDLVSNLTGMNTATKFLMQELNMVGKAVIGIAAVGEKVFMGLSYYYNEGVHTTDLDWIDRMKFKQEFHRIEGRSNGIPKYTIKTTIADTNLYGLDENEIRNRIYQINDIYEEVLRGEYRKWCILTNPMLDADLLLELINDKYKYKEFKLNVEANVIEDVHLKVDEIIKNSGSQRVKADLMISLLLSAATDNAKELILAKINAGTLLAKMYIHLIILGFNISDIVKFMTCGAASVIDKFTSVNMFDEYLNEFNVDKAIKKAKGYVQASKFLEGNLGTDESGKKIWITNIVASQIKNTIKELNDEELISELNAFILSHSFNADKIKKDDTPYQFAKTQDFVDFAIQEAIKGNNKMLKVLEEASNKLTNYKVQRCFLALLDEINYSIKVISNAVYSEEYHGNFEEYLADIDEFKKIYDLSTEMSTLGTAFFGLNKGLSTKTEDLLLKLGTFERLVYTHEDGYGFNPDSDTTYEEVKKVIDNKPYLADDAWNEIMKIVSENDAENLTELPSSVKEVVLEQLKEVKVYKILLRAKSAHLVKNFDATDYVLNTNIEINNIKYRYRDLIADYYNLIKDLYNVFDIMNRSPQYTAALDSFKVGLANLEFNNVKFNILNTMRRELRKEGIFIGEKELKKLTRYSEKLLISKWIDSTKIDGEKIMFPKMKGSKAYTTLFDLKTQENTEWSDISSTSDKASFKYFIENVLLPALKRGVFEYTDANGLLLRVEVSKNNKFIKNLIDGIEDGRPLKKLNLLMNEIETAPHNMKKFLEILSDLVELSLPNCKIGNMTIADYFVLYSLMTSLNRYGNDKLTAIFQPLIKETGESSLINNYLKFIGLQDWDFKALTTAEREHKLYELGFDIEDAKIELAGDYNVSSERTAKEDIIRVHQSDGFVIWKQRKNGSYETYAYMPDVFKDISTTLRTKRQYNINKDAVLNLLNRDTRKLLVEHLLDSNILAVVDSIRSLMAKSFIRLTYKCN